MIKNYILITFRNVMKNKVFITINLVGMSVAVALCIVGYFAYDYDKSFDAVHQNALHLYRVSSVRDFQNKNRIHGVSPFPLGEVVRTFQDVDRSSRYLVSWSNFKRDVDLFPANLRYVDPDFFEMFSFDFIYGNASDLNDKSTVFISEEMAVRLFGNPAQAVGASIGQVVGSAPKELRIAAVFRDPAMNTTFYSKGGSAYVNFTAYKDEMNWIAEDDWNAEATLFLQINDPQRVSHISRQLQPFIENNNRVREEFQIKEFVVDPFLGMAHRDRSKNARTLTWAVPSFQAVIGAMVMGFLILLIACFNLTNTSIALASRRLKEIGIRKVMGSRRKHLIAQFLSETMFICFAALIIGILLADPLVRAWNFLWPEFQLTTDYLNSPGLALFLVAILLFTALLAGFYPALYISRFEPVEILKGKLKFGGTNYFTRSLLAVQFAISLIAIVSAIAFMQNARYQRDLDFGFDVRGCLLAWVDGQQEFENYKHALQANPKIISIGAAKRGLAGMFGGRTKNIVKHESAQIEVDVIGVGDGYLSTMGIKLVEGRNFNTDSKTDQRESVIITESVAAVFGWDNALGKELMMQDSSKLFVVGVVHDIHNKGIWAELTPLIIRYVPPEKYGQIVVSTRPEDTGAVNAFMAQEWTKLFPNQLYEGHMFVEELYLMTDMNMNIVYMFTFMGLIAIMLSATGLYSMVSLNIVRRTKEIGVRKILGASMGQLAGIIHSEFVVILLIASALGSWASYLLTDSLMSNLWRYYRGVNVLTFGVAISVLFVVSFCAIAYKIIMAASVNPVESLRND